MGKTSDRSAAEPGLIRLITQISKAMHKKSTEDALGMKLKSLLLLSYLRDNQAVTQQELEAALMTDANYVVLLLNELEAARWLVRRRDPDDRRRHIVELTASGRQALDRAEVARERLENEFEQGLTPEERATLFRLLKKISEAILQPA
jgi:DNA-binding MarR family transcriptional regulator